MHDTLSRWLKQDQHGHEHISAPSGEKYKLFRIMSLKAMNTLY